MGECAGVSKREEDIKTEREQGQMGGRGGIRCSEDGWANKERGREDAARGRPTTVRTALPAPDVFAPGLIRYSFVSSDDTGNPPRGFPSRQPPTTTPNKVVVGGVWLTG